MQLLGILLSLAHLLGRWAKLALVPAALGDLTLLAKLGPIAL